MQHTQAGMPAGNALERGPREGRSRSVLGISRGGGARSPRAAVVLVLFDLDRLGTVEMGEKLSPAHSPICCQPQGTHERPSGDFTRGAGCNMRPDVTGRRSSPLRVGLQCFRVEAFDELVVSHERRRYQNGNSLRKHFVTVLRIYRKGK